MRNIKRCFLCFQTNYKNKEIICEKCYEKLEQLRCFFCLHCGKKECLGCGKLSIFKTLHSLYAYTGGLSEIVVLAKEENSYVYKKLFYALFFQTCKNYLRNLIQKENFQYVILPIMKKERILNSYWHPAMFFSEIILSIFHDLSLDESKIILLHPWFSKKLEKQALIPRMSRSKMSNLQLTKDIQINDKIISRTIYSGNRKILLLDDILTSGQTALLMKKSLERYFFDCEWHFFSILRSPQGGGEDLI